MIDLRWIALSMALAACQSGPAEGTHPTPDVALWEPVDAQFAGCQGACGVGVDSPQPDVVAQPGATIGQRVFCPVSGAVFEIEASHPHADIDGQRLWFCCAGCAEYFEQHRDRVLDTRRIGQRLAAREPTSAQAR